MLLGLMIHPTPLGMHMMSLCICTDQRQPYTVEFKPTDRLFYVGMYLPMLVYIFLNTRARCMLHGQATKENAYLTATALMLAVYQHV
jgi:hypothetical protein